MEREGLDGLGFAAQRGFSQDFYALNRFKLNG
jgi:hypothetical protein